MIKTTYCYFRVSKETQSEQNGGYGMTRQKNILMEYLQDFEDKVGMNYHLSTENVVFLRAEGVSAFSGKNVERGSVLMNFIEDVQSGRIRNAVLLIENIDRFSRMNPQSAARLFLGLIDAGCDIHEAESEIVHHPLSDLNLISAGLTRSNKESTRKQKMSIKNWDKRFSAFVKKEAALTAKCPAWLRIDKNKQYEIIESEAVVYRKIFELYNKGFGQAYIRDYLNANDLKINNRTIGSWMIHKVLTDDRLVGKVRIKSKLREQYSGLVLYPVVVDEQTFKTAQTTLSSAKRGQKINRKANNLFAGMAKCGLCKDGHLVVNFDGSKYYMRCGCSINKNKRCYAIGFKYRVLEKALLQHMRNFDPYSLEDTDTDRKHAIDKLTDELINVIKYRDEVQNDIDKVDIPDPSDRRILKNLQTKVSDIELNIENLKSMNNVVNEISNTSNCINDELYDPHNVELRTEFNIRLRRIIKSIYAYKDGSNLRIGIEYYIGSDVQWISVDSSTGEFISDIFIGSDLVEFDYRGVGKVIFNKETKKYYYNNKEISNDDFIKLLSK